MANLLRRGAVGVALLVLLLGVPVLIVSPSVAERFLLLPDRRETGPPPTLGRVAGEVVSVETYDGLGLRSWWFEVSPEAPAVLLLHGNAGNIAGRVPLARGLVERGVSVLLLEYRGYGGNEGTPTIEGLTRDARAGLDELSERVGAAKTVLLGRSVGGAIGVQAVADRTVGGVILESTFTSLEEIAESVYPILPSFFFRRLRGHLDTRAALARVRAPVLVVHGTRDGIVPLDMGLQVYEAAREPKDWYGVTGAGHNDVFSVGGDAYFDRLARFVQRATDAEDGAGDAG